MYLLAVCLCGQWLIPQYTLPVLAARRRWVRSLAVTGLHIKVRTNSVHALRLILDRHFRGFDGVLFNL